MRLAPGRRAGGALSAGERGGLSSARPHRTGSRQGPGIASQADLNLVMVFDGLRSDSINPTDTPNLFELLQAGVSFPHANAAVPSVTRVNAATMATGTYPDQHGIIQNVMYLPEVNPNAAVNMADAKNLLALRQATGTVLLTDTIATRLQDQGKQVVTIGSGSSGPSYLFNPDAEEAAGRTMETGDPNAAGTLLAIPASHQATILERFGPPPTKTGVPNHNASVDYMTEVFLGYVLADLAPDVAYVWFTEPDNAQHANGVGVPSGVDAIRNDDRNVGLILDHLQATGLDANIFVTSDHGLSKLTFGVNVARELVNAGLKESPTSTDVIIAGFASTNLYVRDRDPRRIRGSWSSSRPRSTPTPSTPRRGVRPPVATAGAA